LITRSSLGSDEATSTIVPGRWSWDGIRGNLRYTIASSRGMWERRWSRNRLFLRQLGVAPWFSEIGFGFCIRQSWATRDIKLLRRCVAFHHIPSLSSRLLVVPAGAEQGSSMVARWTMGHGGSPRIFAAGSGYEASSLPGLGWP